MLEMYVLKHKDEKCGLVSIETGDPTGVVSRIHVPSPAEGLLRVEFGEGMMIISHHLRRQIYGSTRTLTILDPECIFPVYLYCRSGCSSSGIFLADV